MFKEEKKFWRSKTNKLYELIYSDMTESYDIICKKCKLSSGSGGGCPLCEKDVFEFIKEYKNSPLEYLTENEIMAVEKFFIYKKLIKNSLSLGEKKVNLENEKNQLILSEYDNNLLKKY